MGIELRPTERAALDFVWLEITGRCQLRCEHCYADSGPDRTHGMMTTQDWIRVIDESRQLGASMVQFIGGEPTLHPDFLVLAHHALDSGVRVEVYTNLVHVGPAVWELFDRLGVEVATSYYSRLACQHDAVTHRRRSHELTLANIREAIRRGIRLRVSVIEMGMDQDAEHAVAELQGLGVAGVGVDEVRRVGRAGRGSRPTVDQLCGQCSEGKLAVVPSGATYPCVFSRWLPVGNARDTSLHDINRQAVATRQELAATFSARHRPCLPCRPAGGDGGCEPFACRPVMRSEQGVQLV